MAPEAISPIPNIRSGEAFKKRLAERLGNEPKRAECVIVNCSQLRHGRGLCRTHYDQVRAGTFVDPRPMLLDRPDHWVKGAMLSD